MAYHWRNAMSRPASLRLLIVTALVFAPLTLSADVASAQSVIQACIKDPDHDGDGRLARIVAADEPCKARETRVTWSTTGPQGPKGAPGVAGTPGPAGIAGIAGPA